MIPLLGLADAAVGAWQIRSVGHTRLWKLNTRRGPVLQADEFVDAVCAGPTKVCVASNTRLLDTGATHASCCALGEATGGHNSLANAARSRDPTAEAEVPGLIQGTELRPADVQTSALGNALTALDVSCSPHAQEAGLGCTQTKVDHKLAYRGSHLQHPPCPEQ